MTHSSSPALCRGLVALTLMLASPSFAVAQTQGSSETPDVTASYPPEFFETFAPVNASEMIGNIPGFNLQSADFGRGLGSGGANVIINGERLTGKTNVYDQLGRIPATNVVKIEILDGATSGIPGLSGQVANIVTESTGLTGTWEWQPSFRKKQRANLYQGEISVSGSSGNFDYTLGLNANSFRNGNDGPEELRDALGVLTELRDESARFYGESLTPSIDLSWTSANNHIANMNAEYTFSNFSNRQISKITDLPQDTQTRETFFLFSEDETNGSLSADYDLPLGPGRLKLIGELSFEDSPIKSDFTAYERASAQESSIFIRQADEKERIARAEYDWETAAGHDWQISAETAYNSLDNAAALSELDSDSGVFENVNLDGASAKVGEQRYEVGTTYGRNFGDKWDIQTSLGAEYSELSVTSTSRVTNDFIRPKGFLSASYKVDDSLSLRARLEREVGQLSFFDFISVVDQQQDQDRAANFAIVPDQSWVGELELDKNFGDGITLNAKLYGEQITDIVDRIPIGENGDAIGNIDEATRYGLELASTLNGKRWGLEGMELNITLELQDSNVIDPVEGFERQLSDDKKMYFEVDFRHDIPGTNWAYGAYAEEYREYRTYRLYSYSRFEVGEPFFMVYGEHKDIFGAKAQLRLMNLLNVNQRFETVYYDDRRDIGGIEFTEERNSKYHPFVQLKISGTF